MTTKDTIDRWNKQARHLPPEHADELHTIVIAGVLVTVQIDEDDDGQPELHIHIDAQDPDPELAHLTGEQLPVTVSTYQPDCTILFRHSDEADAPTFHIDLAQPPVPAAGDAREIIDGVDHALRRHDIYLHAEPRSQNNTRCADASIRHHRLSLRIHTDDHDPHWTLGALDDEPSTHLINRPLTDTPELIAHIINNCITSRRLT